MAARRWGGLRQDSGLPDSMSLLCFSPCCILANRCQQPYRNREGEGSAGGGVAGKGSRMGWHVTQAPGREPNCLAVRGPSLAQQSCDESAEIDYHLLVFNKHGGMGSGGEMGEEAGQCLFKCVSLFLFFKKNVFLSLSARTRKEDKA